MKQDLSKYCRNPDIVTTVLVQLGWNRHRLTEWLTLGEINLCRRQGHDDIPSWVLSAYLGNHTDFEHDSAYVIRLGLVSVVFECVAYGQTHIHALIDPNEGVFEVPKEDWNPFEDSTECTICEEPHKIVEYVPPGNRDLYEKLRGKRISIITGVPT